MMSGCDDHELVLFDGKDQAVFVGDSAGPVARELMLERLGFTDAGERCSPNFVDELVDAFDRGFVVDDPVPIVVPGLFTEEDVHSARGHRVVGGF